MLSPIAIYCEVTEARYDWEEKQEKGMGLMTKYPLFTEILGKLPIIWNTYQT